MSCKIDCLYARGAQGGVELSWRQGMSFETAKAPNFGKPSAIWRPSKASGHIILANPWLGLACSYYAQDSDAMCVA